jgi:hypothetical protein
MPNKKTTTPTPSERRGKNKEEKEMDTCWASCFWPKSHYWAFENPQIYLKTLVQKTQPVSKIDPALLTRPYTYFKAIFAVLFTFLVAIQFHFHKES